MRRGFYSGTTPPYCTPRYPGISCQTQLTRAADLHDLHAPIPQLLAERAVIPVGTPQSAEALAQQVSRTLSSLRDPQRVAGQRIDGGALAKDLAPGLRRLEAAITSIVGANAEVGAAREAVDRAFAHSGRVVPGVARTLEGLGGLAGEEGLAGRMLNWRG